MSASLFREPGESFPIEFIIGEDKPRAQRVAALLDINFVDNGGRTTPHFELKGSVVALGKTKPEHQLLFHAQTYDPYRRVGIIKLYEDPAAMRLIGDVPIEELEIGVRAYNALKRIGLDTIGDVAGKTARELRYLPTIGDVTIKEIEEELAKFGLHLREKSA
jgi:DNA-directed RNA polymerase alpha subunit